MGLLLNVGVIGAGILGEQYVRFFREHPETQVAAVADVRSQAAERIGTAAGAQVYTDYREMLKAQALDLVVVATPDPSHRDPVIAALEAGAPNVILEKPLATTLADALAICETVEKRRAKLFVNYANRGAAYDIATRYVVQQGLLGEVVYGEARLDDNIIVPTGLWGERSQEWAAGSSTAHFLLSHVVDLLRWYFSPAEVQEVYAISQATVLGFTPDLYDAFLTFDSGLRVRVKAEWIKHIDELVEFYLCFSGRRGTLICNKRGGFGTESGWRANVADTVSVEELLRHRQALDERGARMAARVNRPDPTTGQLSARVERLQPSLEARGPSAGGLMALVGRFVDAILEDTLTPASWRDQGPLPTHIDGLKQTAVVAAIVRSAAENRVVKVVDIGS
jgi:predicted dehydrogenase